jgi:hypothetical protein
MLFPGGTNCRSDDMLEALFPPSLGQPGEIIGYDQVAADKALPQDQTRSLGGTG